MTTPRSGTSSTTGLVVGVGLVLALAAVLAVTGDRGSQSTFDPATVTTPTIVGTAIESGASDVPAPVVEADALLTSGQQVVPVEGQATMIVFLAHWCSHCNAEVPVVVDWLATDPLPENVELVAVATAIDATQPNYPPDTWLADRDWTAPAVVDSDGSIAAAYGVVSYPAWVFVDADGTVLGTGGAQDAEQLDRIADALAAG